MKIFINKIHVKMCMLLIFVAILAIPAMCHKSVMTKNLIISQAGTIAQDRSNPKIDLKEENTDKDKYWLKAKEIAYKKVPALIAQHQSEIKRGINHVKLMNGNLQKKQIAITFDDGPHPDCTPKLLSILKKNNVKATFFVIGMMAEQYPELIKMEQADGHCIGNHTYHHVNMTKIPEGYIATEIKACGEVVQSITGKAPHLFRPPGGDYNDPTAEASEALGYTMVLWTDDPGDYASPGPRTIMKRIKKNLSNGGIILIHDGVQQTVDILPDLIKYLKNNGYELVTIDEMMDSKK